MPVLSPYIPTSRGSMVPTQNHGTHVVPPGRSLGPRFHRVRRPTRVGTTPCDPHGDGEGGVFRRMPVAGVRNAPITTSTTAIIVGSSHSNPHYADPTATTDELRDDTDGATTTRDTSCRPRHPRTPPPTRTYAEAATQASRRLSTKKRVSKGKQPL